MIGKAKEKKKMGMWGMKNRLLGRRGRRAKGDRGARKKGGHADKSTLSAFRWRKGRPEMDRLRDKDRKKKTESASTSRRAGGLDKTSARSDGNN